MALTEIVASVAGGLSSGLLGVVTGLVGNITTSFINLRSQKLKNEHDIALIKAESDAMIAEAQINIKVTEATVTGELEKMDAQIYETNVKLANVREVDNKTIASLFNSKWTAPLGAIIVFLLGLVDVLKGIMRPGLTLYLTLITSWITYKAYYILEAQNQAISANQALVLFNDVTTIVIYLTVSVVTWWFGDRRTAKFIYRLNDGNLREK